MTDDIAARLRAYFLWSGVEVAVQAADEIERLRARVAELEAERAPAP